MNQFLVTESQFNITFDLCPDSDSVDSFSGPATAISNATGSASAAGRSGRTDRWRRNPSGCFWNLSGPRQSEIHIYMYKFVQIISMPVYFNIPK